MKIKTPGLPSNGSHLFPRPGSAPESEHGNSANVVVFDNHPSRLPTIIHIVAECGARPLTIGGAAAIEKSACSGDCAVAVVGLGRLDSADETPLDAIRALKGKGFKIISCADGAQSWPLGAQCQPLLSGSVRFLDSAAPEFSSELRDWIGQLLQAENARRAEDEQLKANMRGLGIVGESEAMLSIFRWVLRVSVLSDLPVLITGETGTGKQILANAIYRLDPKRRNGPFVAVNCGAISPMLAESELFGHRRGAFTGADRDRKGLIRSAHEGILFLDEIGELDQELQTKLLRTLQEKRVLGVGEDRETAVDVRVIAATNQNLDSMVEERRFRVDLFHRLNVLSIHVPPLRERRGDVKPLVEYFLRSYGSLNPKAKFASADFFQALMELRLPGNVRQLENLVRQALIGKNDHGPLTLGDLPLEVWRELSAITDPSPDAAARLNPDEPAARMTAASQEARGFRADPRERSEAADLAAHALKLLNANGWNLSRSLDHCEKLLLEAALHQARGNQTRTAKLLGITPRSVYNKYRKHNLTN